MPLIAPQVFQVSLNGTYDSQPIAHVLHFVWEGTSGTQPSRSQMGGLICNQLASAWKGTLTLSQSTLVNYSGATWIDLDSLTGPTGVVTGGVYPIVGENTGQSMPGNVAMRIIKNSTGGRGSRKGSLYLPGCAEAQTSGTTPNTMSGSTFSDLQARCASFYTNLTNVFTNGVGGSSVARPVMVRTRSSEYLTTSAVTGFTPQPRLASQRRRLDLT